MIRHEEQYAMFDFTIKLPKRVELIPMSRLFASMKQTRSGATAGPASLTASHATPKLLT